MSVSNQDFAGRTVAVTGAANGLGASISRILARRGATVAVLDIDREGANGIAAGIAVEGGRSLAVECDIGDEASVKNAVDMVGEAFGKCDALVNNATIMSWDGLEDLSIEDWDRVVRVNLRGYFLCMRAFGVPMLDRPKGGSIVNIGSICARNPSPGSGAYSPTKAAEVALARQGAKEWGPRGVRVNAVSPGMALGGVAARYQTDPEVVRSREHMVALDRIGGLEEMVEVVLFLISDEASAVNGQDILVDGGFHQMLIRALPRPGVPAVGRLKRDGE